MRTDHLVRIAVTLEQALEHLQPCAPDDTLYDLFRNAAIKSFELGLETGGKSLRRALKEYVGAARTIDALSFNDVLRQALKFQILRPDETERWLQYRLNRNSTAHDYGKHFANQTLRLLPTFASDLRALAERIDDEEMTGRDGLLLSKRHRKRLIDLLAIYVPEAIVWAYGSRISGGAHEGSDLDIVLLHKTTREAPVDGKHELIDAIEESSLPMLIDVSDWSNLPEWLRREIECRHVVLSEPAEWPGLPQPE